MRALQNSEESFEIGIGLGIHLGLHFGMDFGIDFRVRFGGRFGDQFAMFFAAFRIFRLKYGWSAAVIPRSNIVLFLSDIQQLIIIVLQYWVYM